jgi:hypothetical protein
MVEAMINLPSDVRWRWIAGLGVGATLLAALVMELSRDRAGECRSWLASSQAGSIAEAAALKCLSEAEFSYKAALVAVIVSALTTATALAAIARRRDQ